MDPEFKKALEELKELTEENNKMLHSMRRSMRVSQIMSLIYWVFIIGSAVGAIYLLQPYLENLKYVYEGYSDVLDSMDGLGQ